jgi:hypothetical protein
MSTPIQFHNVHIQNLFMDSTHALRMGISIESFTPIDPSGLGSKPVRPTSATNGTICATIYLPSPGDTIIEVKGYVYSADIFVDPSPISQPPPAAIAAASLSGFRWAWGSPTTAAELPNAVHNAAGTAKNILAVWKKYSNSSNFVYDGSLAFNGITGGSGSCGANGGSNIMVGSPAYATAGFLASSTLLITIAEGKKHRTIEATKSGPGVWVAKDGGITMTLTIGQCGKKLVLETPMGKAVSHEISGDTKHASFDAHPFDGKQIHVVAK